MTTNIKKLDANKFIPIDLLNQYEKDSKLISNKHPILDCIVWNYSRSTQYNNDWNKVTIKARALVTDLEGNVLNNPLPKFFNFEEKGGKYALNYKKIDKEPIKLYKKYDGCLIVIFYYHKHNQWIVMSRGSFDSEFSKRAEDTIVKEGYDLNKLSKDHTYCLELTSPDNKIVVDYKETKLTLLAIRHNDTGIEEDIHDTEYNDVFNVAELSDLNISKRDDLSKIKDIDTEQEEGYVVKQGQNRCKIKFHTYIRLHSFKASINNSNILNYIMNPDAKIESLLDQAPDEMYQEIKDKIDSFHNEFNIIKEQVELDYLKYKDITSDKYFARDIKTHPYKSLLFNLRKQKDITLPIWKIIQNNLRRKNRNKSHLKISKEQP